MWRHQEVTPSPIAYTHRPSSKFSLALSTSSKKKLVFQQAVHKGRLVDKDLQTSLRACYPLIVHGISVEETDVRSQKRLEHTEFDVKVDGAAA
jgi:hypothetical protein